MTNLGREAPAVSGSENGSSTDEQTVQGMVVKQAKLNGRQKPLIAAQNADRFPAMLCGGFRDGADDRIEARAIAAAGDYSNFFVHDLARFALWRRYVFALRDDAILVHGSHELADNRIHLGQPIHCL